MFFVELSGQVKIGQFCKQHMIKSKIRESICMMLNTSDICATSPDHDKPWFNILLADYTKKTSRSNGLRKVNQWKFVNTDISISTFEFQNISYCRKVELTRASDRRSPKLLQNLKDKYICHAILDEFVLFTIFHYFF